LFASFAASIALDLPGGCSIGQEVAHVLAVAEAIDGPVVLFGHSSGAVIGQEAILARPELFSGRSSTTLRW
jgi:pimeloyl-ACP methyl ester carboxylesterase